MLTIFIGNVRQGKTLGLSIFAFKSKKTVFANYKLERKYIPLDVDTNLFHIPANSDVFIDECYAWLESRNHQKKLNQLASYILFQSGKLSLDFYLTAQLFSTIDVRFRTMANVVIFCTKLDAYKVFQYDFYTNEQDIRQMVSLQYNTTWYLPFDKASKYFSMYNTLEIINPYHIDKLEQDFILQNPKKLYDYCIEIAKDIKDDVSSYTHDKIKLAMLQKEYDLKFEKYVYLILKKYQEQEKENVNTIQN